MATSHLPQEILIEIFSWLPVKSVGKCRCLAKSWRILLSTPQFIESHLTRRRGQENLIITTSSLTTHSIKDDAVSRKLEFPGKFVEVVGSCNGLVLLVNNDCEMFLVNPVTLRQVKIPDSTLPMKSEYCLSRYGFGYDRFSSDYKIVEISYHIFGDRVYVDVYSVKRGIWKSVHNSPYDNSIHALPGAFVNGAIHWLASIRGPGFLSVIAAFDLVDEVFDDIPVPDDVQKFEFSCHLVVLGGCLCIFETQSYHQINFWVMKEYGVRESWTKFSIHADCVWDFMKPLQFIGDENVVLLSEGQSLVVYNLKDQTLRDMFVDGVVDATTFVESLVSPSEEACYN